MSADSPSSAHTASRRAMLDRLRTRPVQGPPLPTIDEARLTQFDDPIAQFQQMLAMVGGESHLVDDLREATEILNRIEVFAAAKQIVSLVPEITGNFDAAAVHDPHDLASLDWVIAAGEFAVAENGAIWVDGNQLPHRVLLFIPQYLALVVSRNQIVHHMHQAYDRIGKPAAGFGVFVSGPSKTADIEQSLVLGAHGCRTLQVFLTP